MKKAIEAIAIVGGIFILIVFALGFLAYDAEAAGSWADGVEQTDYSGSVASGITGADTTRWDSAGTGTNTPLDQRVAGGSIQLGMDMTNGIYLETGTNNRGFIVFNATGEEGGGEPFKIAAADDWSTGSNGFFFTVFPNKPCAVYAGHFATRPGNAYVSTTSSWVYINDGGLDLQDGAITNVAGLIFTNGTRLYDGSISGSNALFVSHGGTNKILALW